MRSRTSGTDGTNPGRTADKAREHLRAVISWAWEQDLIESPPRFPKPRPQQDATGRHELTKAEVDALYFATHQLRRPRGWNLPIPVGRFWRAALVVFFNYGVDSGTVWRSAPVHEPILWRHISWSRERLRRRMSLLPAPASRTPLKSGDVTDARNACSSDRCGPTR